MRVDTLPDNSGHMTEPAIRDHIVSWHHIVSWLKLVERKEGDVLVPREGLIHDLSRPVLTMNYSYPSITPPGEHVVDVCIPVLPDRRIEPRVIH